MINLKKVVIWALVAVNIFFLLACLYRIYSDRSYKAEALKNLSTLLGNNGIYIDADKIHEDGELAVLETSRDMSGEQKLADTLLGNAQMTDQGGGIISYSGDNGYAKFYNGNEFEVVFTVDVYHITTGAVITAKSLLQLMNVETASVSAAGETGNETVTAICAWNNHAIFNCYIKFDFNDGNLVKITVKHASNIKATADKTDMSSCATALLFFLNDVKNGKYSCTQITRVDPGYNLGALGDGISAVWRIETDTGVYYIDAVTGKTEHETQ